MNREKLVLRLSETESAFDFVVIGGGATGIGIALEAATRGYSVILLEQSDFTKSTSSKSTKLVHGGVRYLAQGNIGLVREACVERGLLVKNAPHLVRNQPFVIPAFGLFDEVLYTVGLTFYDLLAGKYSLGRSLRISKTKTLEKLPTLKKRKVSAGIEYHDGQFDDSRLAINALQTAIEHGACAINYMPVKSLLKNDKQMICGVSALDLETGKGYEIKGKAVINATGVFADEVLQMDSPGQRNTMRPSQGIHLVLDKSFLGNDYALMIPKTNDGRVLFAVPWHGKVVVGTTDTPIDTPTLEPVAIEHEIDFILNTMAKYLTKAPTRADVLSIFAGLRPLAAPKNENSKTKEISRSHKITVTSSQLFTMIGGKWTTFRRMAQDMVDKVEKTKNWERTKTATRQMKLHGYKENIDLNHSLYFYGSDKEELLKLMESEPNANRLISSKLNIYAGQVIWAVRYEMARTVEDFLSRRVRCLILDAREALQIAPRVAQIMAKELGKDEQWEKDQIKELEEVASNYILQ
ncbi:MAG: glycerol-3-phosphate dehydrogenase/oxidase [Bacteroidales bacterium]|nr:glycerol-3-phosphate dehydrogenase/oxidase [Bacteroidales bacterium]MDD4671717.1 glycerol-3-phosphate dehydrogenase/oxidase [Bacteroidales bacterium]MDY0349406.1 glycerol-3-phosphate dehydrogenase/oxidase [Tenuifilaceae bacterium]